MTSFGISKTGNKMYPYEVHFKGDKLFEDEAKARAWMRRLDELLNE